MRCLTVFVTLVAMMIFVNNVRAEKAGYSLDQLREVATHIVVGKVIAIYKRTTTDNEHEYTNYVAEIQISKCEKGDELEPGDLVYARYWRSAWLPGVTPLPGTSGHTGLPAEGETLRVYLAQNAYDGFTKGNDDGGFNVIGTNGFEKLKPGSAKPRPKK
jgi:hypothetical protein